MALANGALAGALLFGAAGESGARLRFGTSNRWAKIRNEVHAEFGWWPEVTSAGDGYRTLARQVDLFKRNYTTSNTGHGPAKGYEGVLWWRKTAGTPSAAVPGRSNHGFGTTVDVVNLGGLNQFTTTRYKQFAAVAARHGFSNAEGRSIGEPWHWSDTLDPDNALDGTTTTPTQGDDDLTAQFETDVRGELLWLHNLIVALDSDVRGDLVNKGSQLASIAGAVQPLPALDADLRGDLLRKGQQIVDLQAAVSALSTLVGKQQGLDIAEIKKAVSDALAGGVHVSVKVEGPDQ